jgi:hypothetical protein
VTELLERTERFSGHESFVCRYGWLPKVFRAVISNPSLFKDEDLAITTLGIGRNMVKSLQFWGEVSSTISPLGNGKFEAGLIGACLLNEDGWDPYLESLESLWLIHWQLSTNSGMAAWNEVFGEGKLIRFDRQGLINALKERSTAVSRTLAPSTLEQHAAIFIQSYYQTERGLDDTSWCPLQDLGLIKATATEDGRIQYNTDCTTPVGLSSRVFAIALIDFLARQEGTLTANFHRVLRAPYSPGIVFRLDEHQLRQFLEEAIAGPLKEAVRFVDTADTQNVVLTPKKLNSQFRPWAQDKVLQDA